MTLIRAFGKKTEYNALLKGFFVGDLGAKTFTLKERQNGEYALHVTGTASSLKKIDELISKSTEYHGSCFHILQKSSQTRWLSHKIWTDLGHELELLNLKIRNEEANIIDLLKGNLLIEVTRSDKLQLHWAILIPYRPLLC